MRALATVWAVLWKDLVCEWRSRERIVAMGVFALLVVVVFNFALPGGASAETAGNAPGLLWVTTVFAALLGLNRALAAELENDALSGLALARVDRGWVFVGKALSTFVLLALVQALTAFAFAAVFQVDWWAHVGALAGVFALGSLGICSIGTLLSAMAVRTRFRELVLPVLLLPTLVPLLGAAVHSTVSILQGDGVPYAALQLLLVADGVYLIVSFLGFEYILDE